MLSQDCPWDQETTTCNSQPCQGESQSAKSAQAGQDYQALQGVYDKQRNSMEEQMEYEKKLLANANPGDNMKDMFAASKQTGLQVTLSLSGRACVMTSIFALAGGRD